MITQCFNWRSPNSRGVNTRGCFGVFILLLLIALIAKSNTVGMDHIICRPSEEITVTYMLELTALNPSREIKRALAQSRALRACVDLVIRRPIFPQITPVYACEERPRACWSLRERSRTDYKICSFAKSPRPRLSMTPS